MTFLACALLVFLGLLYLVPLLLALYALPKVAKQELCWDGKWSVTVLDLLIYSICTIAVFLPILNLVMIVIFGDLGYFTKIEDAIKSVFNYKVIGK